MPHTASPVLDPPGDAREAVLPLPRVLCVDDDPEVLQALVRTFRGRAEVVTAPGPNAGLRALEDHPEFSVVFSDLRMGGSDGVTFLSWVRELAPDTTRVLLTGQPDVASSVAAVNDGAIFRFLTKPCRGPLLLETLRAAVEHRRAAIEERRLLDETRRGSVRALSNLLALVRPAAAGRAERIRDLAVELGVAAGTEAPWAVAIAASLSQLGALAVPDALEQKLARGEPLTGAEALAFESPPEIASQVVACLPEMEGVREVLARCRLRFDGAGAPAGSPAEKEIPLGARILRVATDYVALESRSVSGPGAVEALRARAGEYDPDLLDHLSALRGDGSRQMETVEVELRGVRPGMVFAEELRTTRGVLLVARGVEATPRVVERLRGLDPQMAARQRIYVMTRRATP
ncbi:MAG TPA: HD domain-containing phosphohydrolase [Longimicrobiaceae bacterium]